MQKKQEGWVAGLTHAGGVVYRMADGKPQFLIITSLKNPRHWVLPKGHIEIDESAEQTAVREVWEETGVRAVIEAPVCAVRMVLRRKGIEENIKAQVFLMRAQGEPEPNGEGRTLKWCSFGEALAILSFDELKKVLVQAMSMLIRPDLIL